MTKFNGKKVAELVLAKRTKENLTFRGIAKATKGKLTIATLNRIESGTQIPRADTLADIANWLNKPVAIFFTKK